VIQVRNSQDFAEEVLTAYGKGWEDLLSKAALEAVAGSTGVAIEEVSRSSDVNSLNNKLGLSVSTVSGMVSIRAGRVLGQISLSFHAGALLKISSVVYEKPKNEIDKQVLDCAGELTNLTYGLFKRGTSEKGFDLTISIPTVLMGEHKVIPLKADRFFCVTYQVGGFPVTTTMVLDLASES
jgi:CheY-specific phosphatase CheX